MIAAIIVAAGLSRRMGQFKLTLPWGTTTVIGQVVATLEAAGVSNIVTVTGHRADEVRAVLTPSIIRIVFNPHYATGEMLSSVQVGLRAVMMQTGEFGPTAPPATLLCLGDQPQMEVATVQAVLAAGKAEGWSRIVIPSYQMRAGHPILLPSWLWPEIQACTSTLRDVMAAHRSSTHFLTVDTASVLADLDTPEDYETRREPHANVPLVRSNVT